MKLDVPPEQLAPALPQPLAQRADRTEPAAERLAKEDRDREERDEQEHPGRVDVGDDAGQRPVLEVHQRRDRQPAFDARRPRHHTRRATALEVPHPQVELDTNPQVQQEEPDLDDKPRRNPGRRRTMHVGAGHVRPRL